MKKIVSILAAVLLSVSAAALSGCGDKGVVNDDNTLNIKVYKAGYGDTFVKAWISQFEQIYAEEGYKINIVESNENIQAATVTNELILGKKNKIDLYITGNIFPADLARVSDSEEMEMVAENLNDVYDNYPIRDDGSTESVKISEKLKPGFDRYFKLGEDYYCFAFRSAPLGLVVNPGVFRNYASEYPRTTDEFLSVLESIYRETENTGVYPLAWAGKNAHSYLYGIEDVWVSQYSGTDYYADFCAMNYPDKTKAYELYSDVSWEKSLDVIRAMQNPYYSEPGSINNEHTRAQSRLITGKAVFMSTGAWLQNEMFMDYADRVVGMEMIPTPVISALGIKLGLDGKGGSDADLCDEVLSLTVKLIREGKSYGEINSAVSDGKGVSLIEDQIKEVENACGVFYDWGIPEQAVINAYSRKKDIAKLFLRYIASDDAARTMYNVSSGISAYASADVDYSSLQNYTAYMKSVDEIIQNRNSDYIYRQQLGLRAEYQMGFFNKYPAVEKTFATNRDLTSATVVSEEYAQAEQLWKERIR